MYKKEELINKFHSVHNEAISSKDVDDMHIASDMFIKTFNELAECNPKQAQEIVECYEGSLKYYNFLTESEAMAILDKFMNQDGSKGAKWRDPEEFFSRVQSKGWKVECEPNFNRWALYVAMNKSYSDQNSFITKWVGDDREKYFEACYELALTMLKDKDNTCWIRSFYNLDD